MLGAILIEETRHGERIGSYWKGLEVVGKFVMINAYFPAMMGLGHGVC